MTNKRIIIITLMNTFIFLSGMHQLQRKITGNSKSKNKSIKLSNSAEKDDKLNQDNTNSFLTSTQSTKQSIKSLEDLQKLKSFQSEVRDKSSGVNRSNGLIDRKITFSGEQK